MTTEELQDCLMRGYGYRKTTELRGEFVIENHQVVSDTLHEVEVWERGRSEQSSNPLNDHEDDNEYEETMRACADGCHPDDQIEAGWAYEGDNDVPNGTITYRVYRCRFCGEEWT
jgi:hypothetical protein